MFANIFPLPYIFSVGFFSCAEAPQFDVVSLIYYAACALGVICKNSSPTPFQGALFLYFSRSHMVSSVTFKTLTHLFLSERKRGRERKASTCCSTKLYTYWLLLKYALTGAQTGDLGVKTVPMGLSWLLWDQTGDLSTPGWHSIHHTTGQGIFNPF